MRYLYLIALLTALPFDAARAAEWLVRADGSGDYPTIQSAIEAAAHGDTLSLADGTFTGDGNRDISLLGKSVWIRSQSGDPASCVIDCGGTETTPRQGFLFTAGEDSTTVLESITVSGAWSVDLGGAAIVLGSSPTFHDVTFRANHGSGFGSVLYADGIAEVRMRECRLESNSGTTLLQCGAAGSGYAPNISMSGCVVEGNNGTVIQCLTWGENEGDWLRLEESTFINNTGTALEIAYGYSYFLVDECSFVGNNRAIDYQSGYSGAGDWEIRGTLFADHSEQAVVIAGGDSTTIEVCEFTENAFRALEVAGEGYFEVVGCLFQSNSGSGGSAIWSRSGDYQSMRIQACEFYDNSGAPAVAFNEDAVRRFYVHDSVFAGNAGGVYADYCRLLDIRRSTFYANSNYGIRSYATPLEIHNSIVAYGAELGVKVTSVPAIHCTNIVGNAGGDWRYELQNLQGTNGNISQNPQFCDLQVTNLSLAAGSPCLDDNNSCGTMGAYPEAGCEEALPPKTYRLLPDGTGDFPTIQAAIDTVLPGSEIVLADGVYSGPGNRDLRFFNKPIVLRSESGVAEACVIDCEGSVDAQHSGLLFLDDEGPENRVADITIRNANGNAVRLLRTNPVLERLRIVDSQSLGPGSALHVQCDDQVSPLLLEECSFVGNSGPAAVLVLPGGPEYDPIWADLTLNECIFQGNEGDGFRMQGNEVDEGTGSLSVQGCEFVGNGAAGLSILPLPAEINNCQFRGNQLGVQFLGNDDDGNVCRITGSTFEENTGAGLYLHAYNLSLELSDSDFLGNLGGGIDCVGGSRHLQVRTCRFVDNSRPDGGAAIRINDGEHILEDCLFDGNTTQGSGGAIENWDDEDVVIRRCDFLHNSAARGGAYWGSIEVADSCQFRMNSASERGGAVYQEGNLNVSNSSFLQNSAPNGAIAVVGSSSDFSAVGCTFGGNSAAPDSAQFFVETYFGNLGLSTSILAFGEGEAVDVSAGGRFSFTCLNIFGNSGGDWTGPLGAFLGSNGNISLDPLFCNPRVGDYTLSEGSPCLAKNHPNCTVTLGAFVEPGCEVPASAVYLVRPDGTGEFPTIQAAIDSAADRDTVSLANGVFSGTGNRDIDLLGKKIVIRSESGDPSLCVIDCQGTANDPHRGFIFRSGENDSCLVMGLTITGGAAYGGGTDRFGGAIYCTGSSPTIRNCIFELNEAERNGGAINLFQSEAVIEDCIVRGNKAPLGGGINSSSSSPQIIRTLLTENLATEGGGGIRVFGQGPVDPIVSGVTVAGNNAPLGGGFLVASACSLDVSATIVWDNCAEDGQNFRLDDPETVATLRCSDVQLGTVSLAAGSTFDTSSGDNIASDPLFCEPLACETAPDIGGVFTLDATSPCLEGASPVGCGLIGARAEGCDATSDTPPSDVLGGQLSLTCSPNPFTDRVVFQVYAPSGDVDVTIFDAAGKRVRTLVSGAEPGRIELDWDGRNDAGNAMARGIYFCRARSANGNRTLRVVSLLN